MKQLRKIIRTIFHPDHLIVSVLTVAFMALLYSIIHGLEFMNPVDKLINDLSMIDIYYRINNSGEARENQQTTIVDITDLSVRQRDSIGQVVRQVVEMEPAVLGVDVIFEREGLDEQADTELVLAFLDSSAADSVPIVLAEQLFDYQEDAHAYGSVQHSFFAADVGLPEGCINGMSDQHQSLSSYPVYQLHGTDTVYSLPAVMAEMLSGQRVVPDIGNMHAINYRGERFPVVDYRDLPRSRHLIEGRNVLIGTHDQHDSHQTPIGPKPGVVVIAHTLDSMLQGSHVFHGGQFWIVLVAIIAGYLMNLFEYTVTWGVRRGIPRLFKKRGNLLLDFFTESELYDKVVAFIFMVIFTGFTYWLFFRHGFYVNTWLALATIAFIEEGRLIYKAWLSYRRKKGHRRAGSYSLYAHELEEK